MAFGRLLVLLFLHLGRESATIFVMTPGAADNSRPLPKPAPVLEFIFSFRFSNCCCLALTWPSAKTSLPLLCLTARARAIPFPPRQRLAETVCVGCLLLFFGPRCVAPVHANSVGCATFFLENMRCCLT